MNKKNLPIIRQQFAQCVFNHKIHEKACDRIENVILNIKKINIAILVFVIIFLVLQLKYPDDFLFGGISMSITVFEILFLFVQKEFSFEEKAKEHKKIALKFLELRDKYKNFIIDVMNNLKSSETMSKRDLLQEQYQIISDLSPQTKYVDYVKTQLSLLGKTNTDEEFTWSDREINRFLPKELRIKN
ncbi:MAG: SLATT domain-containing protein [Candidatus Peregrinibacteria bacterium]|nr:SLATT domain-containing protein [Candidatus Peregrinibacteria bacterium]